MSLKLIFPLLSFVIGCSSVLHSADRSPADIGQAQQLQTHFLPISYGKKVLNLRVGVQNPLGTPIGDILYIHGFADRLDNHQPLFLSWTAAGFRVISFDLPSHGENSGDYNNLNNFSFRDLAELAAKVEQETKANRPLILSGWSTGGLVVVRMLQEKWTENFSRPVNGAILFAPGVSVRKFPWTFGNRLGFVSEKSLTHNPKPPHFGKIGPDSPFWTSFVKGFAPRLLAESALSQHRNYPLEIPTLVMSAGDIEDVYAKEKVIRQWVRDQNESRIDNKIVNISCPHSKHEMDNEPDIYGGEEVRASSAAFARAIVFKDPFSNGPNTYGEICTR